MGLLVSLPVGVVLTEIVLRTFPRLLTGARLRSITQALKEFQQAQTDELRQALLLSAGMKTLLLSLGVLGLVAVLAVVFCLPLWAADLGSDDGVAYGISTSITAALWCVVRRWLLRTEPVAPRPATAPSAGERDAR
jgi:hypothetical protein